MSTNLLTITCVFLSGFSSLQEENGTEEKPAQDAVTYKMIKEVKTNSGFSWIIAVDAKMRNEKSMRRLGEKLVEESKDARIAHVLIYANEKAARLKAADREGKKLNKTDTIYLEKNFLGSYTRNKNSGLHELEILVKGLDGPSILVKY